MPSLIFNVLSQLSQKPTPVYPHKEPSSKLYAALKRSDKTLSFADDGGLGKMFSDIHSRSARINDSFHFENGVYIKDVSNLKALAIHLMTREKTKKAARCYALICQHLINAQNEDIAIFDAALDALKNLYIGNGQFAKGREAEQIRGFLVTIEQHRPKAAAQEQQLQQILIRTNSDAVIKSEAFSSLPRANSSQSSTAMILQTEQPVAVTTTSKINSIKEESKSSQRDSSSIDPSEYEGDALLIPNKSESDAELTASAAQKAEPTIEMTAISPLLPVSSHKEETKESKSERQEEAGIPDLEKDEAAQSLLLNQEHSDSDLARLADMPDTEMTRVISNALLSSLTPVTDSTVEASKGKTDWKTKLEERELAVASIYFTSSKVSAKLNYLRDRILPTMKYAEIVELCTYLKNIEEGKVANLYFREERDAGLLSCIYPEMNSSSWQAQLIETRNQIINRSKNAGEISTSDHKKTYELLNRHTGYSLWALLGTETRQAREYREANHFDVSSTGSVLKLRN